MTCTVTLCDTAFADITSPKIEIEAYDPPHTTRIHRVTNGVLSGGAYGAVLTVASTDIYDVVVDTAGTSYAPGVIHDLNGARSPSLDIVLLVRPPPASATPGTSVQTSAAVMRFVLDQSWTEEQKKAVLACIEVFVYLRRVPPNHFQRLRMDLEDFLRSILIDPDSIR